MNTHADKTQENKKQSVVNAVSQKISGAESIFQFVYNGPKAIAQSKLQEMANNSPRAMQLKAMQDMTKNRPQAKQVAQLFDMATNHSAQQQHPIQKKENNTGLPDNLKAGIENLSGYSMDDVKVHRNSNKPAQFQAHAYAQGTDIHLGPGQEKHLPHEAWHVVQQKQVRVKPTIQVKGIMNVNDDITLEKEADEMGRKAQQINNVDMNKQRYLKKNIEVETIAQRVSKNTGMKFMTTKTTWSKSIDRKEFETYLKTDHGGTEDNPYENIENITKLRKLCDKYLTIKHKDKLGNDMASIDRPDSNDRLDGFAATFVSDILTEIACEEQKSWKTRNPQWISVHQGVSGKHNILYRFCDYNEIEKMLPRIVWETYDDTVESVKAKKRRKSNPDPDHTLTWDVIQYLDLKKKGEDCLKLIKGSENLQNESEILDRAFDHMGKVITRLSPFVSLSEDLNLLIESTCPTMQSIIRSDENLEDLESTEEFPGHEFHADEEEVQRAKGYQRAPHIVKFEIPDKFIITPEMVDIHKNLTQEELDQGLGLKAMRDAKERLFLGIDVWKYAVEVASNPY